MRVAGLAAVAASPPASEADLRLAPAPVNRLDDESLQRGARNFVNYCLNCHSAKYMRYNRLTDLGLTEQQIKDNLMFATDKIGDTMTVAMTPAERARRGSAPCRPTCRSRRACAARDWLYNYLLGFYRDDKTPTGWNNLVFPNVGMPHVLWQLSGHATSWSRPSSRTTRRRLRRGDRRQGPVRGRAAPRTTSTRSLTVAPDAPGTMTRGEYEAFVADLVNYLDYMAEPSRNERIRLGIVVLLFLGVLFVLAYWTEAGILEGRALARHRA